METSGALRRRFSAKGHHVISCDMLPPDDGAAIEGHLHRTAHWQGDVFEALESLNSCGWWPDLAIFHPTCTYHATSGAWAFGDPDFAKYPGVGYHQRVKAGTLVGAARREARASAEADVERIAALPIKRKVIENPRGTIPTRTSLGPPQQVVHPYEFGDDASKATCLWLWGLYPLQLAPSKRVPGRMVFNGSVYVERWGNQTNSGQNNVTPADDRWKDRSETYPGIADAMAQHWG